MADKLAGNDVEDVLSSVRRLVSDEGVLRHNARAAEPAQQDRLILTPALRVVPSGGDWEVDEAPELPVSLIEPEVADDLPEEVMEDLKSLSALEATIAELEAAVDGHAEFEPDGGEESTVLDYPPKLVHGMRMASGIEDGPRRRLTLGVPDGADDLADAETPPAEPQGALRLVPRPEEATPGEGDVEEILLDEDALRQMVAEIVREELQGVMGERITSNIRKLIRREIHDYFDVRDDE